MGEVANQSYLYDGGGGHYCATSCYTAIRKLVIITVGWNCSQFTSGIVYNKTKMTKNIHTDSPSIPPWEIRSMSIIVMGWNYPQQTLVLYYKKKEQEHQY